VLALMACCAPPLPVPRKAPKSSGGRVIGRDSLPPVVDAEVRSLAASPRCSAAPAPTPKASTPPSSRPAKAIHRVGTPAGVRAGHPCAWARTGLGSILIAEVTLVRIADRAWRCIEGERCPPAPLG